MRNFTPSQFRTAFQLALEATGNDFVNELVRTAPVDTSFLRNSIRYNVNGYTLEIHMPEYAYYVEFGTGAHEIRAVNAKALHWKTDGKDHFAQRVWHPGTDPQPFIRTAINTKLRDIYYKNLKRQLT